MNPARRRLPLVPLTRSAFAPYGEVIDTAGVAPETINAGTAERFAELARIEVAGDAPAAATIGIYRAQPRSLPLALLELERHPLGSQAFVPLHPARYLVVVAGRGAEPAPADLRVFVAQRQQGVSLGRGVWHHALLVLDRPADFLVVERGNAAGNLDRRATAAWGLWLGD